MKKTLLIAMFSLLMLSTVSILTAKVEAETIAGSVLYAGGSNPGVVYKYAGDTNWDVISSELGYAVLCLVEYDGHIYAGTTSAFGSGGIGQVYRYDGGTTWTLVGDNMDNEVCSLTVYQGDLYAGTAWNGMKLYRYDGGTSWTQVISSITWSGTRSLYVSHGYLLMGDVHYDRFGRWDGSNFYADQSGGGCCIYDYQDYDGYVYAAAYTGRLWRSTDAIHWSAVLGYYDGNMWELEEFQNKLYMSYNNGELWAYDGTGDLRGELVCTGPDGIISMTIDEDYLYFGTGGDAVGFGPENSGIASVYRYDGTNAVRISDEDEMQTGVQVLYICPVIPVYVDIKPASWPNPLQLKKKGVLPVAVCGTEDFDITTIDPETIELTLEAIGIGVTPLRWSYEDVATPYMGEPCNGHDYGADGYLDLTLKFETQEVVETLGLETFSDREVVILILTGNLKEEHGGIPIQGQECIVILHK